MANILCPDGEGKLATIKSYNMDFTRTDIVPNIVESVDIQDGGDMFQCYFVSKNSKFVMDIEYPDEADWLIGGGDDVHEGLVEVDQVDHLRHVCAILP